WGSDNPENFEKPAKSNTRRIELDLLIAFALLIGVSLIPNTPFNNWLHGSFLPKQEVKIDYHSYIVGIQKAIKEKWTPPKGDHTVKMAFKLHRDGHISDVKFTKMTFSSEKDAAALKAVVDALPNMPAMPAGAPEDVDIDFTFESHTSDNSGK
ncbi:MAG: TonB C-terminal domain-containing protein, partial [Cyanobacteria bacterium SZAS-4]|nr:TonB C-terminal domain-containing protein [Cyanobacteria bacterium SZAS-4]